MNTLFAFFIGGLVGFITGAFAMSWLMLAAEDTAKRRR